MAGALDVGRLLRLQAMVSAAQIKVTPVAADALVKSYGDLRDEIRMALLASAELSDLRDEFARLFPEIHIRTKADLVVMSADATEALLKLRQLGGWIQGLIDEMTLEQRIQAEAEEKAKLEAKPSVGFAPSE